MKKKHIFDYMSNCHNDNILLSYMQLNLFLFIYIIYINLFDFYQLDDSALMACDNVEDLSGKWFMKDRDDSELIRK